MAEEYAKPSGAVLPDASANDDARQGDRRTVAPLQGEQAGTVLTGVIARQVAYLPPIDPDSDRVGIM